MINTHHPETPTDTILQTQRKVNTIFNFFLDQASIQFIVLH